ncbi:hypothetical protein H7X87_01270 [Acetobacteraceae bacterium]|nr:hypothetical protein [Candidatus Parcubacteria bacterium]
MLRKIATLFFMVLCVAYAICCSLVFTEVKEITHFGFLPPILAAVLADSGAMHMVAFLAVFFALGSGLFAWDWWRLPRLHGRYYQAEVVVFPDDNPEYSIEGKIYALWLCAWVEMYTLALGHYGAKMRQVHQIDARDAVYYRRYEQAQ